MLQTIYEGESSFSTADGRRYHQQIPSGKMHNVNNSVDIKTDVPLSVDPLSPLDLRTELRMLGPGSDPGLWERQLQQELLLIQKQQQIQKQLLISEFQKQHEKLSRQHQAQLQEHLKLQQELQTMKQQQELAEKERRLEQQNQQEKDQERHRREMHVSTLSLRAKERSRESAVASTEVKQKLQEFLLNKTAKDPLSNGGSLFIQHPKLWYMSSHHTSLDQSSPPPGGTSPTCQYTLPSPIESKDDFPLRKTASEPNLKVRSRLKQKVAERRSSPMLKRRDSTIMTPYKKRALEIMVDIKTDVPLSVDPLSPLDLRTELRMLGPGSDPGLWERQLQQELLLIQKQQQIQKQLLISEFQKQHEKLSRQHQAQLQEHLKLQQELQTMKQQQELAEKERRLEQQNQQEKDQERHRREMHVSTLSLRAKERSRESLTGAVASTEVKQKLQEFLLNKTAKDPLSNGGSLFIQHPKLWYMSSHHTSLDQSSPPPGGTSPTCQYTLPSPIESKDDFPLRKTGLLLSMYKNTSNRKDIQYYIQK
ncbi:histone deacetylase 9-B-like [Eucyclogobius newberryi]|uniref:histone deacetylase 9-B-like n=1 Tax=Eucyclogobius newberryi TaxID=166745 RepID=UPI003B596B19